MTRSDSNDSGSMKESVETRFMPLRKYSSEKGTDDVVYAISARKYTSNRRYFYILRRSQSSGADDMDLYRNSVLSSSSTRTSILSDSGGSSRPFLLDVLFRQMSWRPYKTQRSTDEEEEEEEEEAEETNSANQPGSAAASSGPDIQDEILACVEAPPEERFEVACFKSRDHWREGRPPKKLMDMHELLYISSFKQRVDRRTMQYCLSLCGERSGLTFWLDDEAEWRQFREKLNDVFLQSAKQVCHRIEYACNVVIKQRGLGKTTPGPTVHPVVPGPYRLLVMDSKLVFVRDSISKPVLTIYYQWIRRMVRQMQYTMLRRAQSVFSLELGHMADTGEGLLFFRVVDEPSQRESPSVGSANGALPFSPLSDMLLRSMKDNSLIRQLRRSSRKSRASSSYNASENSTGSSSSTDGTSTLVLSKSPLPSVESSDIKVEASESRYLTMEIPEAPATVSKPLTEPCSSATMVQSLYVDYFPAGGLERSCSEGATSASRPAAAAAAAAAKAPADLSQPPWCRRTNGLPMVASLSLVTTSSESMSSQANSSFSSLATQNEKPTATRDNFGDDYGSLSYDTDASPFRLLS